MRIQFTADPADLGIVADAASKRISGRIIPFDQIATPSVGPRCQFASDGEHTIDGPLWLNREHDDATVLGSTDTVETRSDGMHASFTILDTSAGRDALIEAGAGARGGLSIEAEILAEEDAGDHLLITRSRITGAALVRRPAFTDATVYDVAATAATATEKEEPMPDAPEVVAAAPTPPPIIIGSQMTSPLPRLEQYIIAMGQQDQAKLAEMGRQIRAADPNTLLADIAGLIPKPIVAPVISLRESVAPLFNALGPNAAPAGASFRIPKITTHLAAAAAAAELTDMTAPFDVGEVTVTMSFIKRAVAISQEAIVYSQPGVVAVAQQDLAAAIQLGSEGVAVAGLEGATGTNPPATIANNGADAWSVLSAAVAAHYAACGQYPTLLASAPDVWSDLVGFTNAVTNAPIISTVNASLVGGNWGSLFGIPVVVSPAMTAGKAFLVSDYGVKTWADGPMTLQLTQPTTFRYELGGGRNVGLSVADGKFITPVTISLT